MDTSHSPRRINRPDRYELVKGDDCRSPLCGSAAECHGHGCRLMPVFDEVLDAR